jgi:hypothetical protein
MTGKPCIRRVPDVAISIRVVMVVMWHFEGPGAPSAPTIQHHIRTTSKTRGWTISRVVNCRPRRCVPIRRGAEPPWKEVSLRSRATQVVAATKR